MKKSTQILIALGALTPLMFNSAAQAGDLNMRQGNWKMSMQMHMAGEVKIREETTECTTAEDLNVTTDDLFDKLLSELHCSTTNVQQAGNAYSSALTCQPSSVFQSGDIILIAEREAISIWVKARPKGLENMPAVVTMLMHRVGNCTE